MKRTIKATIDLTEGEVESWIDALLTAGASEICIVTDDRVKLVTSIEAV